MIGTTLGSYRIITELGSGAMGTVYYAEHLVIGRRAAIKVLRPELALRTDLVERFLVEARAVNEIRHPNIVDISEIGSENNLHFLVMELLEGCTLGERLERQPLLAPDKVVAIVGQVAAAVGAAHERGIVHRDIKPENVFLTNHPDEPDRVKVLDFGIVKLLEAAAAVGGGRRNTQAGVVLGTPTYMSPEQCTGEADLDHRSDIYSLGIVAYEALTGQVPFKAVGVGKLILAHVNEPPRPPRELNPDIPAALSDVVLQALAKSPADRPATMRALRSALETALQVPLEVRRRAVTVRAPRLAERPRATEPEHVERAQSKRVGGKLREIVVQRLAENRLRLPSMPFAVLRAIELLRDPEVEFPEVASVLEADPLVAARLLRIANSAVYGTKGGLVTTLEQAVSRLGVRPLQSVLVEMTAREVFSSRDPKIQSSFQAIWRHCVAVATIARDVSLARRGVDPDVSYLAGLLHDVGKPVVGAFLLEAERSLGAELGEPTTGWMSQSVWLRTVEECHRDVGARLVRSWKLPEAVGEVVSGMDTWDRAAGAKSCTNVVHFANELAKREGLGLGGEDLDAISASLTEGREILSVDDWLEGQLVDGLIARVDALTGAPVAATPGPARPATPTDIQGARREK
jgi:putative nucleotidyltransferase with HDIG domain